MKNNKHHHTQAFPNNKYQNYAYYSLGKKLKTNYHSLINSDFFKTNDIFKRLINIDDYNMFDLDYKDFDIIDKEYSKSNYFLKIVNHSHENKIKNNLFQQEFIKMIKDFNNYKKKI